MLLPVAASHVLGDLRTVRSFMEHWVAAYNGQQLPNKPMPHIHELLDDVARDRYTPEVSHLSISTSMRSEPSSS